MLSGRARDPVAAAERCGRGRCDAESRQPRRASEAGAHVRRLGPSASKHRRFGGDADELSVLRYPEWLVEWKDRSVVFFHTLRNLAAATGRPWTVPVDP